MSVQPYNNNHSKKEQVRDMFDAIAPKYDLLNHVLSMNIDKGWRRRVVKSVQSLAPSSILDIATGTGDLAIALKKRIPQAAVTGSDLSPEMLEVARGKIAARELNIELIVADAEKLPFHDESFDVITAAFGVRNFENTVVGLSQMRRVLRTGGTMIILEFSTPPPSLFAKVYRWYFRNVLPRIGRLVSKDSRAYSYLPESVDAFACGDNFVSLLREAGFQSATYKTLTGGVATIYNAVK